MSKPHKHLPPPPRKARVILEAQEKREQEVDKSLQAIYVDNQPQSDFSRLDRSSSWVGWRFLFGIVFFVGILTLAAWAGLVWIQPLQSQQAQQLGIHMEGPKEITLGEEQVFTVSWENKELQTLSQVQLHLGFPQEFTPTNFQPTPDARQGLLWNLGTLPAHQSGKIVIKGIFLGTLGKEQAWQAIGTYRAPLSVRDAQVLETQPLLYAHTALQGDLRADRQIVAGDPYILTYQAQNATSRPLENGLLRLTYPQGFVPASTSSFTLLNDATHLTLPIPSLPAHATRTVNVVGSFRPPASGVMLFTAEMGQQDAAHVFIPLHATTSRVAVIPGDLTLHAIVNGADAQRALTPGELLHVTLAYQNTSPEHLKEVVVTLGFESVMNGVSATGSSLLDWTKLENFQHGVTSTRARVQTLRFDKKVIPELADLAPQAEGTIEVTLPSLLVATGTREAFIQVSANASLILGDVASKPRVVRTPPVVLSYRTDANLTALARYFTEEGAPIGVGPLPPVVGKTTTYRLILRMKKTLHGLENVVVQGTLPENVHWTGHVLSMTGTVTYDSATRIVKWQVNKMPENMSMLESSFDVELTPQTADLGRFAVLFERPTFEVRDMPSQESLSGIVRTVTTDLELDENARGKGVVKK